MPCAGPSRARASGCSAPPTGLQAVDLAATQAPDLVVLDLWLPDIDGVEVVRRLRGWLDVPILILSGDSDEERRVDALDSGADDFLQKPFGFSELTARLRALRRRTRPRPGRPAPGVRRPGGRPAQGSAALAGVPLRLTPTEWQLLEAMVTHPGKLLTHRWLVARVWGGSHGDESRQALRTHIRSLRAKIGDDATTPPFLRTESGAGYRWLAEPSGAEPPRTAPAVGVERPAPTRPGPGGRRAARPQQRAHRAAPRAAPRAGPGHPAGRGRRRGGGGRVRVGGAGPAAP